MKKTVRIKIEGKRHYCSESANMLSGEELGRLAFFEPTQEDLESFREEVGKEGEHPIELSEGLSDDEIAALLKKAINEIVSYTPTTELDTMGEMSVADGTVSLSYDESDITGMPGSRTTIRIQPDGIATFSRSGRINSHMVFEQNKRYFCISGQPGEAPVCISTHALESSLSEQGGTLHIDYCIEVGGAKAEHNEYRIEVR